jgi:hypothetical protein
MNVTENTQSNSNYPVNLISVDVLHRIMETNNDGETRGTAYRSTGLQAVE